MTVQHDHCMIAMLINPQVAAKGKKPDGAGAAPVGSIPVASDGARVDAFRRKELAKRY